MKHSIKTAIPFQFYYPLFPVLKKTILARQEIPFVILGNGTFNIYGSALTDSSGQNIQINYSYFDTPSYTQLVTKTFKGVRQ
jgi:hypothetical protein